MKNSFVNISEVNRQCPHSLGTRSEDDFEKVSSTNDLPSVIVAKKPQFGILEARSNPQVCIQDAWGRFCCYKNQEKTFFHLSPLPCSIPLCARCPIPAKEAKPLSMFLVMVLVLIRGSVMGSVFGSNVNKLGMTWYSNIGKLCCKFVWKFLTKISLSNSKNLD